MEPQLGESWVVESDQDGDYEAPSPASSSGSFNGSTGNDHGYHVQGVQIEQEAEGDVPTLTEQRQTLPVLRARKANKTSCASVESELIMPSMDSSMRNEKPRMRQARPRKTRSPHPLKNSKAGQGRVEDSPIQDKVADALDNTIHLLRPIAGWVCVQISSYYFRESLGCRIECLCSSQAI